MTFDPFAFIFARLISNRVSVHHAKEVEELRLIRKGLKGRAASWLELVSGRHSVRRTQMILGVTQEIAEYERDLHAPGKDIGVYPNGVDTTKIPILSDDREQDAVHAAFICGTFSDWHGLDKLISAIDAYHPHPDDPPLNIHLVGKLSDAQISEIEATTARLAVFRKYGILKEAEYRTILAKCDVGISSLAMERQNLYEGSTLKVREMLAMGLAIYSGHIDHALQESDSFVLVTQRPSVQEILLLASKAKEIERNWIRTKSAGRIEKSRAIEGIVKLFSSTVTRSNHFE
jgi:hypothetical protein